VPFAHSANLRLPTNINPTKICSPTDLQQSDELLQQSEEPSQPADEPSQPSVETETTYTLVLFYAVYAIRSQRPSVYPDYRNLRTMGPMYPRLSLSAYRTGRFEGSLNKLKRFVIFFGVGNGILIVAASISV
jgi:hypothetical protein